MKRKHDRAFTEIKNYYNDITLNNLAMISTLKDEIKTKEEKLERNEQVRNFKIYRTILPPFLSRFQFDLWGLLITVASYSPTRKQETCRAIEKGQGATCRASASTGQPGKRKVCINNYPSKTQNRQKAGGKSNLGGRSPSAEAG